MEIKEGVELPKLRTAGRPKGSGINLRLLKGLKDGQTVWEVPKKKMRSIIVSANYAGIRLMVRRMHDSTRYAFKVINEPTNESPDNKT